MFVLKYFPSYSLVILNSVDFFITAKYDLFFNVNVCNFGSVNGFIGHSH